MKVIKSNGEIYEGKFDEKEVKQAFWHTSAHVLAQAVKELYPDTKCAIGPAIDQGFYYDFKFSFPFSEENLIEIEEKMREIVKESISLQVSTISKEECIAYMEERQEDFKLELIRELEGLNDEPITMFKQGSYQEMTTYQ